MIHCLDGVDHVAFLFDNFSSGKNLLEGHLDSVRLVLTLCWVGNLLNCSVRILL